MRMLGSAKALDWPGRRGDLVGYPIEALTPVDPKKVAHGRLVLIKHDWALRCDLDLGHGSGKFALYLTGDSVGSVLAIEVASALAFADDYKWEIRVESPSAARFDDVFHGGQLIVCENGESAISFANEGEKLVPTGSVFIDGLNASQNPSIRARNRHWFGRYQIWIGSPDGKFPDAPLFTVDVLNKSAKASAS